MNVFLIIHKLLLQNSQSDSFFKIHQNPYFNFIIMFSI